MNEITFGFKTGQTLTYGVYQPDGTVRTAAGTALTEVSGTGYYKATNASITTGDIVVIKKSTTVVGYGEYQPEINDDDIITEINANQTLIESVTGNQTRVLNVFDERIK